MTINSRKQQFGFWLSVIGISGALLDLIFFRDVAIPATPLITLVNYILCLVIAMALKNLWEGNQIQINTHSKEIVFKNIITRENKSFPFEYFDGYISIQGKIFGRSIRYLYLVKNKKAVRKICSFAYTNFSELKINLDEIKHLGEFKYAGYRTIKVLLNLPILN